MTYPQIANGGAVHRHYMTKPNCYVPMMSDGETSAAAPTSTRVQMASPQDSATVPLCNRRDAQLRGAPEAVGPPKRFRKET